MLFYYAIMDQQLFTINTITIPTLTIKSSRNSAMVSIVFLSTIRIQVEYCMSQSIFALIKKGQVGLQHVLM